MSFTLNVSLVIPIEIEQRFVIWFKNKKELKDKSLYKVYGSNQDGQITLSLQEEVNSLKELQLKTSEVQTFLTETLNKDFNEDIFFFASALERLH